MAHANSHNEDKNRDRQFGEFDRSRTPEEFCDDDQQQHYLDELRHIFSFSEIGDCDLQITEDHIQALIAEKELQGE